MHSPVAVKTQIGIYNIVRKAEESSEYVRAFQSLLLNNWYKSIIYNCCTLKITLHKTAYNVWLNSVKEDNVKFKLLDFTAFSVL